MKRQAFKAGDRVTSEHSPGNIGTVKGWGQWPGALGPAGLMIEWEGDTRWPRSTEDAAGIAALSLVEVEP